MGVKVTLIWQLAPAANEELQVSVCPKLAAFVPPIEAPEKLNGVPVFVRVTAWAGLEVLGSCDEKLKAPGVALATGKLPCK
jgi:hypothetical protein